MAKYSVNTDEVLKASALTKHVVDKLSQVEAQLRKAKELLDTQSGIGVNDEREILRTQINKIAIQMNSLAHVTTYLESVVNTTKEASDKAKHEMESVELASLIDAAVVGAVATGNVLQNNEGPNAIAKNETILNTNNNVNGTYKEIIVGYNEKIAAIKNDPIMAQGSDYWWDGYKNAYYRNSIATAWSCKGFAFEVQERIFGEASDIIGMTSNISVSDIKPGDVISYSSTIEKCSSHKVFVLDVKENGELVIAGGNERFSTTPEGHSIVNWDRTINPFDGFTLEGIMRAPSMR